MVRLRKIPLLVGALALAGLLGPAIDSAHASPLIPRLVSVTPAAGGLFAWTYTASITADERVQSQPNTGGGPTGPDFFVIYDFLGFSGVQTVAANWTFTTQNTGPVAVGTTPLVPDNAAIPNLVMTFNGATPVVGPNSNVGTFTVLSTFNLLNAQGAFTAETTKNVPGDPVDNSNLGTTGFVAVPTPIPEPATMVLALAGPVFVLGAVRRGLRRRAQ